MPTLYAILGWQLGQQCGIKVKHEGLNKAFQFVDYGTTMAGSIAYGGEFTMAWGPKDPAAYKRKTKHGGSSKSGLGLIAYKLSPEFDFSDAYIATHIKNIRNCYRDMADNHAGPLMSLAWGWIGTAASQDESLKKEVFGYYKAWLNMSRCHNSDSYVMLPGRNYADPSYYADPMRTHMTGSVAMLYSFSTPKLQIQGVQLAIPGVNHKALKGAEMAAYKAMLDKTYGKAANSLKGLASYKTSGSAANKLMEYVNTQTSTLLAKLLPLEKSGEWHQLNMAINKVKSEYAGVPKFDSKNNAWSNYFKNKMGALLIKADKEAVAGNVSKALSCLAPVLESSEEAGFYASVAKGVKERLMESVTETVSALNEKQEQGFWFSLKKDLSDRKKYYAGIAEFDKKALSLDEAFRTKSGKDLIKAHKFCTAKSYGMAAKTLTALIEANESEANTAIAKKLLVLAEEKTAEIVKNFDHMKTEGHWGTLKEGLSKNKKHLSGVKLFDDSYLLYSKMLSSPSGAAMIKAEKLLLDDKNAAAAKSLKAVAKDKTATEEITAIAELIMKRIEANAESQLKPLDELYVKGDWYRFKKALGTAKRGLAGIPSYEAKRKGWEAKLKEKDVSSLIRVGAAYVKIEAAYKKKQSSSNLKKVTKFKAKYADTIYGKEAEKLLKTNFK